MQSDSPPDIERIFHQVLELPPDDRAAFLDAECANNPQLRAEIESLIASDASAPGLLERIPAAAAPSVMAAALVMENPQLVD